MHKNAALLLATLAIIAALVVGINIGRTISGNQQQFNNSTINNLPTSLPAATSPSAVSSTLPVTIKQFSHPNCGVAFDYTSDYQAATASDSAQLTNSTTGDQMYVACATTLPRPPLDATKTETATIAGVRATIYHDQDASSGKPIDVILFKHPKRTLEVALFGYGEAFTNVLKSLRIIE